MVNKTFEFPIALLEQLNKLHDDLLKRVNTENLTTDERLETIELQEAVLLLLARVTTIAT
jgi:hypothetical protein